MPTCVHLQAPGVWLAAARFPTHTQAVQTPAQCQGLHHHPSRSPMPPQEAARLGPPLSPTAEAKARSVGRGAPTTHPSAPTHPPMLVPSPNCVMSKNTGEDQRALHHHSQNGRGVVQALGGRTSGGGALALNRKTGTLPQEPGSQSAPIAYGRHSWGSITRASSALPTPLPHRCQAPRAHTPAPT